MATVRSVNIAVPRPETSGEPRPTGIDKRPVQGLVRVEAPGTGRSGLAGDAVFDVPVHGGPDQAVYAYAREDLDRWAAELGRDLPGGVFGENLTTEGLDVTGAVIGERWRIGPDLELEVAGPRIPCATFAGWLDVPHWVKRFTAGGCPGAYLRVVVPGEVRAGDPVTVVDRPAHDVTIGVTFRALTVEPALLPRLIDVAALPEHIRAKAARRVGARPADPQPADPQPADPRPGDPRP